MKSFIPSLSAILCASSLLLSGRRACAFSTTFSRSGPRPERRVALHHHSNRGAAAARAAGRAKSSRLRSVDGDDDGDGTSASSAAAAGMTELQAARTRETPRLTAEDRALVRSLRAASRGGEGVGVAEDPLAAALADMDPRLVVALQMAAEERRWKGDNDEDYEGVDDCEEDFETQMVAVGSALQDVLDVRLRSAREMLAELLDSGEIRKLDGIISKWAKDGKLDTSFFTVLSMNMNDAAADDESGGAATSPTLAAGEGQPEEEGGDGEPASANRPQILQHIYTRCQEELEKNVAPGVGLLNKLLRTEIPSIRTNQLKHYLCPQSTTITSPDGKTIDLGGTGKPLVSHTEFTQALESTVTQIRALEANGATDRLSATNLVESVRQVAMETRVALVEGFGEGSDVVNEFQRDLQPVFRPASKV